MGNFGDNEELKIHSHSPFGSSLYLPWAEATNEKASPVPPCLQATVPGPTYMRRGPTYKLSVHIVTCASNVNTFFPYILECVDL